MRRTFLIPLIVMLSLSCLFASPPDPVHYYGWNIYTNSSYLHQLKSRGDLIITATWGGLSVFNKNDHSFSIIDRSDGLLRNEVRSVHYIEPINETWIGTLSDGISRLQQGEFLSPYQENQGIDAEIINEITDNDQYIFIGSNQGLSMFVVNEETNPSFKKTFTSPQWLSHNNVNAIAFDDTNRIWLATDDGINYVGISYDNMIIPDNWSIFDNPAPVSNQIKDIEYFNGKIYYATTYGFGIIDSIYQEELDHVQIFPGDDLPSESVSSIEVENDSTIWVSFGKWNEEFQEFDDAAGVSRYTYDGNDWEEEHWDDSDSLYTEVADIEIDENGVVWVASWREGLYRYANDTGWINFKPNCISSNYITDMKFDSNRNLWCSFGSKNPANTPKGVKGVSMFNGNDWINYRKNPYGEENQIWSDKIFTVEEDSAGNIWLGSWSEGLGILNPQTSEYETHMVTDTPWISGNNISLLHFENGRMWIGYYGWSPGGITVFSSEDDYHQFVPNILVEGNQCDVWAILLHDDYVWQGGYLSGIQYWKGEGLPVTEPNPSGDWYYFSASDGASCKNFGVQENYGYIFACCDNGLYMYDEYYDSWYKYTSGMELNVKAYKWEVSDWVEHYYYYDGTEVTEARLGFGRTNSINDIFVDQHNRKWLATEYGISMLDEDNYIFTNFTTENSDLPDNKVKSLAYDPYKGLLYAGTQEGLCSFEIGASKKDSSFNQEIKDIVVFPNPFKSKVHDYIYFKTKNGNPLPQGKNKLFIYNLSGELVAELKESDDFSFYWNAKNVASGVYFYVLNSEFHDKQIKGKFAVVR